MNSATAKPIQRIHPRVDAGPSPRISSESLLGARGELVILHNGREYRLRLTQLGKLILTA